MISIISIKLSFPSRYIKKLPRVIFWQILKFDMVFKKWWKKHCASLREKKLWEEF